MGNTDRRDDVVLLLESYEKEGQQLHISFQLQGKDYATVAINDDGFLPEGVISPYSFFLGDFRNSENAMGKPLYFDRLKVPALWEIRGNNSNARVYDKSVERARIFYAKQEHKRWVRVVDWIDERGFVRSSDHYNRYGALFARTIFNAKSEKVNKTYFSADGKEIIMENFVTGNVILNQGEEVHIFSSKVDFILYFFKAAGLDKCRIFYNTLSTPFFVSQRMGQREGRDILFWQEQKREDIPGNMEMIFRGQTNTGEVIVQKKKAFDKLLELGAPAEKVHCHGFVYPFEKDNSYSQEALICTNSDNIAQLQALVEGLPEMHFHIAALTEMSSKLLAFGKYENVELYPNVKASLMDELFKKCDYYFDINYGNEIVSAVYRAFLNNHWIVAFRETLHNGDYVADEHIYAQSDAAILIRDVKVALQKKSILDGHLELQRMAALAEKPETERNL